MGTLERLKKYPHLFRRYENALARAGANCTGCDREKILKQFETQLEDYERIQKIRSKVT